MKKNLLLLSFFICQISLGQVTLRNILSSKYTLTDIQQHLIAQENYKPYPTTSKQWKELLPDSVVTKIINNGDSALTYKFEPISATLALKFVRNGDRSEHAALSFSKRIALKKLILAESVEDKGRFMEAIINGVWSICEESFWGVPAHLGNTGLPKADEPLVELFSAETGALLALTDYFVGDKLDLINKQFRNRIYYETNRRIFEPMLTKSAGYGWMSKVKPVNNWNPWIHSNLLLAALLLEKNSNVRAEYVYNDMKGLDLYLNGLGDEGGCDEGPSYWFAAGASVFDCLETLQFATSGKVDIYSDELIKKMASYIYKTHIGGKYFVNFSDADPRLLPDGLMMCRFGKAIGDEYLSNMGLWAFKKYGNISYENLHSPDDYHRMRYILNLLTVKNIGTAPVEYHPMKNVWINDVQELTARSDKGFYLATHGGHNAESHNHNDVGDFIVYAHDEPIIIDAGRGNYTARTFSPQRYELWFTQSQHHNLPIVNGYGQLAGKEFAAKDVIHSVNKKSSSLSMDIASAYDKQAGISYWKRKVDLLTVRNQVEISDDYSMSQRLDSYQQVFMTVCTVKIDVPGSIQLTSFTGKQYSINYDSKNWSVSVEQPSMEGAEYSNLKTKWDGHVIQRIILSSKNHEKKGKSVFIIKMESDK